MSTIENDPSAAWITAVPLEQLAPGGRTVVRAGSLRVALFRSADGGLHAVDDQCPHEGYPLSKGALVGNVLTCRYHNFKFDVRTGGCTKGDESVGVHNTRVRDGQIEIQLVLRAPEALRAKHKNSLEEGLREHRLGQLARETVRLLALGERPEMLALAAAKFEAEHGPYGSAHATPLAADVCSLFRMFPGSAAALPLMQIMDLAGESSARRPKRPIPEPADLGEDPLQTGQIFREFVEAERCEEAEAMVRSALRKGWSREALEPWFLDPSTQHFLGFGHGLIFAVKAFDLLDIVGWDHAQDILPGLIVALVNETREDALPEWRWFQQRMAGVEAQLPGWRANPDGLGAESAPEGLIEVILHGSREQAFDAIADALEHKVPIKPIVDALSVAAAERICAFNVEIDRDPTVQEGWLAVTHLLTFVNAARHALNRYDSPNALKWLFQAARFIQNSKALDTEVPAKPSHTEADPGPSSLKHLADAVLGGHLDAAVELTQNYLASHSEIGDLEAACIQLTLEDRAVRPIFVAHLIKTCKAAFDEYRHLDPNVRRGTPILAFIKFMTAPKRERQVGRLVHEAIRFVEQGKVPKTLT